MRLVLYDIVTGQILGRNIELEGTPPSVPSNLKYFTWYEPFSAPNNFDSRYYDLQYTETPTGDNWLVEYSLVKRSNADIFAAIENAERLANGTLIKSHEQLNFFATGLLMFFKKNAGIELTSEEEQSIVEMSTICNRIVTNRTIAESKKILVENGQEPDLDAQWEKEL
jgi:hypothetical protein